MSDTTWKEFWSSIDVGEGIEQGGIKIFPLYHSLRSDLDYQILWDATEAAGGSKLRIEEVSPGGSVTDVKVVNEIDSPVLIVEGELLLGAKQNRTVHATFLVGAKKETVIPVACIEPGRWSRAHLGRFGVSPYYTHSKLRSDKLRQVASARRSTQESRGKRLNFAVDQRAVWQEVGMYAMAAEVNSATGDAHEVYDRLASVSGKKYELHYPAGCSGVAVAIDDEIVGVDCFDRPTTMERLFRRLLQGYVLEALRREMLSKGSPSRKADPAHRRVPATTQEVKAFLGEVGSREATPVPSLALGEDVRAEAPDWCGAALAHEGRILHGEVFPWGVS